MIRVFIRAVSTGLSMVYRGKIERAESPHMLKQIGGGRPAGVFNGVKRVNFEPEKGLLQWAAAGKVVVWYGRRASQFPRELTDAALRPDWVYRRGSLHQRRRATAEGTAKISRKIGNSPAME